MHTPGNTDPGPQLVLSCVLCHSVCPLSCVICGVFCHPITPGWLAPCDRVALLLTNLATKDVACPSRVRGLEGLAPLPLHCL